MDSKSTSSSSADETIESAQAQASSSTLDESERWEENIERVLRQEQPDIVVTSDGPHLDTGAQTFRRPSAQHEAIPAPKPAKLSEDLGRGRRVRTSVDYTEKERGRDKMERISESSGGKGVGGRTRPDWQMTSDSDESEETTERETEDREDYASRHATEMPPKQINYFKKSQGARSSPMAYHTNLGLNMDDDPDKEAMSRRVDPHSVPAVYRRSRAASLTPGLDVTKVSYSAFKERLEKAKTPQNLFVEMDVLKEDEWQEQARWIKFEEDLLEGADRWGNPHISSLSFHSLINLRLVLEKCVFLLDLNAMDFTSIVYHLVDEFSSNNLIDEHIKVDLLRALFLPHKYVDADNNTNFNLTGIRRRLSRSATRTSFHWIPDSKRNSLYPTDGKDQTAIPIDETHIPSNASFSDLQRFANSQRRDSIMNRLEEGTEGSMALVGSMRGIDKPLVAFVRLASAAVMPNLLEVPVPTRFLFVLLTPEFSPNMDYHEVGRSFCTLMSNKRFQTVVYTMDDRQDMLNSINHFLDETVVLPPGDWDKKNLLSMSEIQELRRKKRIRMELMEKLKRDKKKDKKELEVKREEKDDQKEEDKGDDLLKRTNVPFGGCIREIMARYPKYWSDIVDGLNMMCVATILYLFFAIIAAAITFGGLWGIKTGGLIGIPETLLVHSAIGCLFSLFSTQPLVIVGVTGPFMVFDQALYKFSQQAEVEFLTWRTWISFWVILIALTVAAFQGSFIVKFFTSFTKDIYAMFIASIYIAEAIENTIESFHHHPALELQDYCYAHNISSFSMYGNHTGNGTHEALTEGNYTYLMHNDTMGHGGHDAGGHGGGHGGGVMAHRHGPEPNTAFKTFILQYCTYAIAYSLKLFKTHHALGHTVRRYLGDFAVPISVFAMIGIDQAFIHAYTDKLLVPEGLDLTSPDKRDWFINPMGIRENVPIWIPFVSVLPGILVYLLLFMETSITELILMDKAKKGSGIHWDICLLSILNIISGLFGGPWICAATVRAMSHLAALTQYSTTHAPGEAPKIVDIKDQRFTSFMIYLLVGLAILISPALRLIPTSCLFGIFLYMGTYSLHGIQFFDRLVLFLMPVKYHPNVEYVRRVRTWKMHLYTVLQSIGFITLWIVKSTSAALAFPFFVIAMIPFRLSFRLIFSKQELDALDGPNADKVYIEAEPDEIADAH